MRHAVAFAALVGDVLVGGAALRTMRATALAVEDEWRQRLGAERLAGFRDTLVTLLSDVP